MRANLQYYPIINMLHENGLKTMILSFITIITGAIYSQIYFDRPICTALCLQILKS